MNAAAAAAAFLFGGVFMDIVLYICSDDPRTIQKNLTSAKTISANIKTDVSIMRPVFFINNDSDIISNHYNYLSAFGKYYFITDITVTPAQALRISAREDVLYTYADQIMQCPAIVVRNSKIANTYLADTQIPLEQYKNQQVLRFNSFAWNDRNILVCAG